MKTVVYQPGTSVLHRMTARKKLIAVFVFGLLIVLWRDPQISVAVLASSVVLALIAGITVRKIFATIRPLILLVVIVTAFQWWARGWPWAIEVLATILSLLIIALVFTVTTPIDETLDVIVHALTPFQGLGINPEKVSLAFSLMIGSIWAVSLIAREIHQAVTARGLSRTPRMYLSPMAIRTVAYGLEKGDALTARGIGS